MGYSVHIKIIGHFDEFLVYVLIILVHVAGFEINCVIVS